MVKPQLPTEIETRLPLSVVRYINAFVPHLPINKKSNHTHSFTISPRMEHDIKLLQQHALKGKDEMWLRDLDDFILQ